MEIFITCHFSRFAGLRGLVFLCFVVGWIVGIEFQKFNDRPTKHFQDGEKYALILVVSSLRLIEPKIHQKSTSSHDNSPILSPSGGPDVSPM